MGSIGGMAWKSCPHLLVSSIVTVCTSACKHLCECVHVCLCAYMCAACLFAKEPNMFWHFLLSHFLCFYSAVVTTHSVPWSYFCLLHVNNIECLLYACSVFCASSQQPSFVYVHVYFLGGITMMCVLSVYAFVHLLFVKAFPLLNPHYLNIIPCTGGLLVKHVFL